MAESTTFTEAFAETFNPTFTPAPHASQKWSACSKCGAVVADWVPKGAQSAHLPNHVTHEAWHVALGA